MEIKAGDARPDDRVVLIDGNCATGRPLGDLADYHIQLRAKQNTLGFIRIRSDAQWTRVLGTVPCGTILWGEGPLKDAEVSSGIAYAVAVRDKEGHICRGYVSLTVIEVADPQPVLTGRK